MPESKPHPLAYAMREWPDKKPKLPTPSDLMDLMARETCGEVVRPLPYDPSDETDRGSYRNRIRLLQELTRAASKHKPTQDTYTDEGWY